MPRASDIPWDQVAQAAQNGSPLMLRAVGRLFGLGNAEQEAFAEGRFPAWSLVVVGLACGVLVGAHAQRHWPSAMAKIVGGKTK